MLNRAQVQPYDWTDEAVATLKRLWKEGLSASQIAKELPGDLSRNAVIGKVHRLKLAARSRPIAVVKGKTHGRSGQPRSDEIISRIRARKAAPKILPFDVEDNVDAPDVTHLIGIMDLERRSCRWPMHGEGSGTLFCGKHAEHGPYCPTHSERAGAGYGREARP